MPHATECAANLLNASALPVLPSSPIPIPGSTNGYGRNSSSSHNASAVVTRTTTINDFTDFDTLSLQDSDKMNISFDQSFSAMFSSDETAYASAITPDPVSRNLQPSYLRDYNCCGVDHQNLVELLQHVDNCHPGLILDMVNGVVIPFETSTVYSQDRWDSIPTPVSSVSTPLTTNGLAHEQKSNSFNTITSASLYSINIPSSINQKHKGNVNNNGLGHYNQGFLQTTPSIDGSSIAQPRRSSTTTIPSQSVTTASQNEQQYGSINISGLGQASSNNNNNIRPVVPLRRSSTSNVTTARSIATTSQVYCPLNIPIDKSKFATYMPSVTAAQYVNVVDGYHSLVGHVSSREAGSGAVAQFAAKYHPIQPKAGVAMSDVYTDPALDMSGMKGSKKRTVSTSSIDAKSTKRRVTKTDESVAETPVGIMSADLSEVENKNETDIYPYKCVVPGCPKVYKNANGLKYHNEHGHASQSGNGAREKPWACHIVGCLKTYGSKGGLIYHVKHCHPNDLWALP